MEIEEMREGYIEEGQERVIWRRREGGIYRAGRDIQREGGREGGRQSILSINKEV